MIKTERLNIKYPKPIATIDSIPCLIGFANILNNTTTPVSISIVLATLAKSSHSISSAVLASIKTERLSNTYPKPIATIDSIPCLIGFANILNNTTTPVSMRTVVPTIATSIHDMSSTALYNKTIDIPRRTNPNISLFKTTEPSSIFFLFSKSKLFTFKYTFINAEVNTAPNIAGTASITIVDNNNAIVTIFFVAPEISSILFDAFFIFFSCFLTCLRIPNKPPSPLSPNKTSYNPQTPFFANFIKNGI